MASVILFDGVCNLCNGFVQFVIARDPGARFQFASLQSAAAARLLDNRRTTTQLPDSIVLVEGDRITTESAAALRILGALGFPWSVAGVFVLVPRPVRDLVYRWVARNRYRWFGRRDVCMMPTADLQARFLDN